MIVPTPWPSAIVALTRVGEVEGVGLADLVEQVAVDGHGQLLRRLAGEEGQDAACVAA